MILAVSVRARDWPEDVDSSRYVINTRRLGLVDWLRVSGWVGAVGAENLRVRVRRI